MPSRERHYDSLNSKYRMTSPGWLSPPGVFLTPEENEEAADGAVICGCDVAPDLTPGRSCGHADDADQMKTRFILATTTKYHSEAGLTEAILCHLLFLFSSTITQIENRRTESMLHHGSHIDGYDENGQRIKTELPKSPVEKAAEERNKEAQYMTNHLIQYLYVPP